MNDTTQDHIDAIADALSEMEDECGEPRLVVSYNETDWPEDATVYTHTVDGEDRQFALVPIVSADAIAAALSALDAIATTKDSQ